MNDEELAGGVRMVTESNTVVGVYYCYGDKYGEGTRRNLVEMKLDSGMIVYKLQFNIELISRCGCCGISQRREYATGSC